MVYIGYSNEDRAIAQQLKEELAYRGIRHAVTSEETTGLPQQADHVVLLISAAALRSTRMDEDVYLAQIAEKKIIPILLQDLTDWEGCASAYDDRLPLGYDQQDVCDLAFSGRLRLDDCLRAYEGYESAFLALMDLLEDEREDTPADQATGIAPLEADDDEDGWITFTATGDCAGYDLKIVELDGVPCKDPASKSGSGSRPHHRKRHYYSNPPRKPQSDLTPKPQPEPPKPAQPKPAPPKDTYRKPTGTAKRKPEHKKDDDSGCGCCVTILIIAVLLPVVLWVMAASGVCWELFELLGTLYSGVLQIGLIVLILYWIFH